MNTRKISHVSEFVQLIEEKNLKYGRNQHFIYRGESKTSYRLLPVVFRTDDDTEKEIYLSKNSELKIINDFMTESASYINNLSIDDMFRWVEYAQHFGVPTRLMDWTSNPLVALYFACSSNWKENGRIYVLNSLGYRLMTNEDDANHMKGKLIKEEARKMIWESEDTFPFPVIFRPYYFDRRMQAQSSWFMVWGYNKKTLNQIIDEIEKSGKKKDILKYLELPVTLDNYEAETEILSEIHIEKACKPQIQRELDNIGINRATLFPGLDGIGKSVEWRNNTKNIF